MVFQNCLNQFRHLFVTFGRADLAGVEHRERHACVAGGIVLDVVVAEQQARRLARRE